MATESSRPLLLPQNRRLRHLRGIYLRKITLSRPRSSTTDDATLNKTAEKLESLRESSEDLRLQHSASTQMLNAKALPTGRRRRSTVWAGQSPGYRQRKLEDAIDNGVVDSFFSLHCAGEQEPIYISEVIEKAMVCFLLCAMGGRSHCAEPQFPILRSHHLRTLNQTPLQADSQALGQAAGILFVS